MENWRNKTSSKPSFRRNTNYNWRDRPPQMEDERNLNHSNERSTSFHSIRYLIELNNQNSDVIILKLIEKLEEFTLFLKSNLKGDWIVLTVAILAKVCSSCFILNKVAILKTTVEALFLQKVDDYVTILNSEEGSKLDKNKHFWNNPEEFLHNLVFVCNCFTEVLSKEACEILPKLVETINKTVLHLEKQQNVKIGKKIKENIVALTKKLNLGQRGNEEDKSGDFPLSNFRTLNVDITSEDILKPNDIPVSKYFVKGRYDNVEHYLSVQFRILKEYFIELVRENITKCIEHVNGINVLQNLSEHGIYSNVVFQSIDLTIEGVRVKFSELETINEMFSSKRNRYFRDGTLVFFTKDNFISVLIGHVVSRNDEQQYLVIRFQPEYINYDLNGSYTIVGTKIFYQPYYYALKALKCMSEVDFPMKKYLVDVDTSVERPGYLNSRCPVYNIQGNMVDLFGNNWPTADQLNMDSYQFSAFKAALTEKFTLIRGFAGTGKTYLGLQIVKTLLHDDNRKIWYNETPILIVSSSNQPLDTFLEGLMSTTNKIIRVGENTSNEKIKKFLLRHARKKNLEYCNTADIWKRKIKKLSEVIKIWIRHLNQIKKYNIIIKFTEFACIDKNVKTSWFSKASNEDLCKWLFFRRESQNVNLHSTEISKIINDITAEGKNLGCKGDVTSIKEQKITSTEQERRVLFSKSYLWNQMVKIIKELQTAKTQGDQTDNVEELEAKLIDLWQIYQMFKVKMSDGALSQLPIKPINVCYDSPHDMDSKDRWDLYFYWLNLYIGFVEKQIVELQREHQELLQNRFEIGKICDLPVIKRSLVLGMSIHVALRLQTTLKALKCRIVVVDETFNILESQLVVSLTQHCEHLILLGNHQKLCPIIAEDDTNRLPQSALSLIERMANNKMQCHILGVQHRMTSKVSQLLVPHFYPEFSSYRVVTNCNLGIPFRVFFYQHEPQDIDGYRTTEFYLYEAKFLINLARYLIQGGCAPEDITILASYYHQMQVLYEEREKYGELLGGVRINILGHYYDQECKIILLSLMKYNYNGIIGYLNNKSNIIFALSRAKECLYMVGNINLLCENSEMWSRVKEVLTDQNCLGNYFPLCCDMNPDHITEIKEPEDFDKIPNGKCEKCGSALNCGHRCLKTCHILDCDHIRSTSTEVLCLK